MQNSNQVQNSTYKPNKQGVQIETIEMLHPKYRIAELIRLKYGEINFKAGVNQLYLFTGLKNDRTVTEWLAIKAGETTSINHLVIERVLAFFNLTSVDDLLTEAHKKMTV